MQLSSTFLLTCEHLLCLIFCLQRYDVRQYPSERVAAPGDDGRACSQEVILGWWG
jgi:hypothetical protein